MHNPNDYPNDYPTDAGLCVLLLGNADIDVTEWSPPQRDETSCTLPIYPQPGHLPALSFER